MRVVCISGKAQHGKDTFADMLKEHLEGHGKKALVFHSGDLVKYVCTQFFGWDGVKDKTGRSLLQRVGTDIVRTQVPDYWVQFGVDILKFFPEEWDYVLVPDCRFPNEYETFAEAGFDTTLVRIERPNFDNGLTKEQKNHASETAMDNYICDFQIINDGDKNTLNEMAYEIIRRHFQRTNGQLGPGTNP